MLFMLLDPSTEEEGHLLEMAEPVYCQFPKYSDTKKFIVITLKFEWYGSPIE